MNVLAIGIALAAILFFYLVPLFCPKAAKLSPPPQPAEDEICEYKKRRGKKFWSDEKESKQPIVFAKSGFGSQDEKKGQGWAPRTIPGLFDEAVAKVPDAPALRVELPVPPIDAKKAPPSAPVDTWTTWTWKQYRRDVRLAARGMLALGLEEKDAVNIFGFNSPYWHMAEMAAIFAGGLAAGIYPSDTPAQVQYKCRHSGASIAVCEDMKKASRFENGIDKLPKLRAVIVWAEDKLSKKSFPRKKGKACRVMTWDDLVKLGESIEESELNERIASLRPENPCCLIYTSGTTGNPKAVMISHDNILWEAHAVMGQCTMIGRDPSTEERLISYLPLSHVAGMMVDIICPLYVSARLPGTHCVYFARPYDLRYSTIVERFKAVRPTMFIGVPRVWEKIAEKLKAVGAKTKGVVKAISTYAKSKGLAHARECQVGGTGAKPTMYGLVDKLVLSKIKNKLGLDRMKFGFTGAAPIGKHTLEYFGSLGIQINEVYGMSECCGATTWSLDKTHLWGSCGYALPGTQVKILKEGKNGKYTECPRAKNFFSPSEEAQGEICFRGRHIMVGYMANPDLGEEHVQQIQKKNQDAIDNDGWLHSGDKGCMSSDGMVRITGRYKELIIGAGGENVAPVPIEANIKRLCGAVSNVMMVGNNRKFNVALVTLKTEGANGQEPGNNQLFGPAADLVPGLETIEQACKEKKFTDAIFDAIDKTNKTGECCPSNAAKIQRFTILPADFSAATGELTPTLKLKRSVVEKQYADAIEAIYNAPRAAKFVPFKA